MTNKNCSVLHFIVGPSTVLRQESDSRAKIVYATRPERPRQRCSFTLDPQPTELAIKDKILPELKEALGHNDVWDI